MGKLRKRMSFSRIEEILDISLFLQRLQQSPHSGAMQAAEFRQQPDAGTAIKFI